MTKEELIDGLVQAIDELAGAKGTEAAESRAYNPDDSMAGFSSYRRVSDARDKLREAITKLLRRNDR